MWGFFKNRSFKVVVALFYFFPFHGARLGIEITNR